MKDREKILRYFTATGEEAKDMAIRLLDLADAVDRGRPFAVGPFMSPFAAQVGQTIAAHAGTITAKSFGGYHEAERIKVAFVDGGYEGPVDFGIKLLSVKWDGRYRLIGHRDVLGSLMGLGIDRAVLGDILMQENGCQILCDADMAQWIIGNFHKVAMVTVTVEEVPMEELHPPEKTAKEVRATVASLRLDAVGAAGFGLSRTKMVQLVDDQRTEVNWQMAKSASQAVKPGDVISVRGRGRIEIKEITGKSRKGRIGVLIERYR
ncbi:MAG: RNA-binding protein [Dialister sp.]|jgi:S4 domain protein|uniref:YlmH family RNA-binding protein n=1 Tax=Dialister TaxID=39948 RepID=UPI00257B35A1|nr:YlmH/Sll1252 family protein [Dialister sp.]MBS6413382.1 RNA-binding protein [Dialister sp.]